MDSRDVLIVPESSSGHRGMWKFEQEQRDCYWSDASSEHNVYVRTQARPAIEFVSGKEGLRPHRVRLHGRPELCNRPGPH